MELPQTDLVAFCSDLGILPSHGAAILPVGLGSGFILALEFRLTGEK